MTLLLSSSLCIVLPSVLSSACLLVLKTCHHNSQKRSGQWIAFILHSSLIYSIKLQEHGPLTQTGGLLFKAGRRRSLSAATSGKQLQKRMFTCCKMFFFSGWRKFWESVNYSSVFLLLGNACARSRANYGLSWSANDNRPEFTVTWGRAWLLQRLRGALAEVKKAGV